MVKEKLVSLRFGHFNGSKHESKNEITIPLQKNETVYKNTENKQLCI